jgi:O-methyltransferase
MTTSSLNEILGRSLAAGDCGQLGAEHQQRLADAATHLMRSDCTFYHSVELADEGPQVGYWDLRGGEAEYLGGIDYAGLRVLEIGAATGWLTHWMSSQGADVVAFDLPPGHSPDLIPFAGLDIAAERARHAAAADQVRNSWWYVRSKLGHTGRAVYGDIYRLPADLGRFDVAVFGSVLEHLANPFGALCQAAAITDRSIVVTDMIAPVLDEIVGSVMHFNPENRHENQVYWWSLSIGACANMLNVLGFTETQAWLHWQAQPEAAEARAPLFTVVASRPGAAPSRRALDPERTRMVDTLNPRSRGLHVPAHAVLRSRSQLFKRLVRMIVSKAF